LLASKVALHIKRPFPAHWMISLEPNNTTGLLFREFTCKDNLLACIVALLSVTYRSLFDTENR
jgi:hypothetical protein